MNKLKTFFNSYFWLIFIGFLIFVGLMTHSIYSDWQDGATNRTVNSQTGQANKAVSEAVNANNAAVNADIERRAEDVVREKTIQPKLENARRKSADSKTALDAAKRRYENEKTNPANLSDSTADNCRKLGELFPNVRFDECGQN